MSFFWHSWVLRAVWLSFKIDRNTAWDDLRVWFKAFARPRLRSFRFQETPAERRCVNCPSGLWILSLIKDTYSDVVDKKRNPFWAKKFTWLGVGSGWLLVCWDWADLTSLTLRNPHFFLDMFLLTTAQFLHKSYRVQRWSLPCCCGDPKEVISCESKKISKNMKPCCLWVLVFLHVGRSKGKACHCQKKSINLVSGPDTKLVCRAMASNRRRREKEKVKTNIRVEQLIPYTLPFRIKGRNVSALTGDRFEAGGRYTQMGPVWIGP